MQVVRVLPNGAMIATMKVSKLDALLADITANKRSAMNDNGLPTVKGATVVNITDL